MPDPVSLSSLRPIFGRHVFHAAFPSDPRLVPLFPFPCLTTSRLMRTGHQGSRVEHPADTHLNICAVLSQIGRHQGALEHAQSALILLQEELFAGGGGAARDTADVDSGGNQPPRADRIAVLSIAYHNMGVEQEFLKKFEHSLQSYRKGVEVGGVCCVCGSSSQLCSRPSHGHDLLSVSLVNTPNSPFRFVHDQAATIDIVLIV